MFQYAFGLSVAKALGLALKLDLSYFAATPTADTKRSYELSSLNLNPDIAMPDELPFRTKTLLDKAMAALLRKPHFKIVKEKHFYMYDDEMLDSLNKSNSLYLDGYWQSYRYIEHLREELTAAFRINKPLTGKQLQTTQLIKSHTCVALHIRRGDYISNPHAAAVHNLYSATYYSNAMAHIVEAVPEAHFLVFSDDINWCINEFPIPHPHTFIQPDTASSATDMYLMSLCRHHIITNSSYSWWGAWLADKQAQIVIAPRQWLADTCANPCADGLIPPEWIRM